MLKLMSTLFLLLLLLSTALVMWGLSWFHMNFRSFFSISAKNTVDILIGIELNLQIAFGRKVIFIISSLLTRKYKISFNFLVSLSISLCRD